jgi:hypothetical protein
MTSFCILHSTFFLQAMPSATSFGFWWSVAGNVALVITLIAMFARKKEARVISPQPLIIEQASRGVTERECLSRHDQSSVQIGALSMQLSEIRTLRVQDSKDSGAAREKLYAAIKDVRLEVTSMHEASRREMSVGFQDIERALGRLEGKINGIS